MHIKESNKKYFQKNFGKEITSKEWIFRVNLALNRKSEFSLEQKASAENLHWKVKNCQSVFDLHRKNRKRYEVSIPTRF